MLSNKKLSTCFECYYIHPQELTTVCTTLLQPNRTNTPVHTETEQYTHIQSSAPEDECNSIRNMSNNKKLS